MGIVSSTTPSLERLDIKQELSQLSWITRTPPYFIPKSHKKSEKINIKQASWMKNEKKEIAKIKYFRLLKIKVVYHYQKVQLEKLKVKACIFSLTNLDNSKNLVFLFNF